MTEALRIAIVGAESTGKTELAAVLAERLAQLSGLRVAWVPEILRGWCDAHGRTPQQHEQAGIVTLQHQQIEAAAVGNDVVVCDTTALMTAVYSHIVFDDGTLDARAVELHRGMALTLLTALDLPWVADGLQRDGPQAREPVDTLLRRMLLDHGLAWSLVGGSGGARLDAAVDAVAPLLRYRSKFENGGETGLFTRLAGRNAEPAARAWSCEFCDDPACEHRLLQRAEPG
ncbi:MAG: ATP-binding protein [Pseudomonadota bacterium]|nr:ATP-binding protein [Pseudomonadota bacterium]